MPDVLEPLSSSIPRSRWNTWIVNLALVMILLVGGYFRTLSLTNWDAGTGQHPDERFFTDVASLVRVPASVSEYFDSARSPGNPRNVGKTFFVYGSLPIALTRLMAVTLTPNDALPETVTAIGQPSRQIANPELQIPKLTWLHPILNPEGVNLTAYHQISKVGRSLVVLFDLGSLVLIFLIGSRLFDRRVGLLAAFLAALAVMSIQQSHFFVDPIFSTFFALLALYWAVRIAQDGGLGNYMAFGVSIGLAMACRITLATLGLVGIVAALLAAYTWLVHRSASGGRASFSSRWLTHELLLLCLAGMLTLVTFRIFQPDAFIGSTPSSPPIPGGHSTSLDFMQGRGFFDVRLDPRFVGNLQEVKGFVSGDIDFYPSQQWVRRPAYLFPWKNMVLWGMGPALGLTVWIAWAVLGGCFVRQARAMLSRGRYAQVFTPRTLAVLVPWIWVSFYFAWQGRQFASTMRYMLPIYGALIIFGAWLLITLWDRAVQWNKDNRVVGWHAFLLKAHMGRWVGVGVVLTTLAWAYAFTRIYTHPHSRVMAAHWMLEHAPPGSTIAAEEWDDALPLAIKGGDPWRTTYKGITMRPYAEDDPAKYTGTYNANGEYSMGMLDQLEQADYITLTSNRVYGSTVRLPMRYPATMRYYHYLFSGDLGFELVADVTSYPRILGISIPDQAAEEAFTVYDHPRVLIFRKTDDFSRERAAQLITSDVNWNEVYKLPVSVADRTDTALRLTESEWPLYRANGSWSMLFRSSAVFNLLAPLIWFLTLELIGLAAFALLFRLLPWLPDRGFTLARTLGLLFVAYAAWLLGSFKLLPFSPGSVWLCALPLLAAGAWMAWQSRGELRTFWQARRGALLTAEAVFVGAFLLLLAIRWLNPDLWHPARGGEKPMDFAYLNAVLKSAAFPAYDPWFAGGYINYYYFGFVIVGALVHLTRIEPAIAYNLAVPTLFALTALGSWGVVYNLLAPRASGKFGGATTVGVQHTTLVYRASYAAPLLERRVRLTALLAPLFVVLLGNLAQAIWFLNGYATQQSHRPEWAFWDATRIVDGTVNEFPFFTFLFADLHAHMIALPFALALVGLTVALVRWVTIDTHGHPFPPNALLQRLGLPPHHVAFGVIVLLLGWLAGTLRATNTWDYPTYVGLTVATLALVFWWRFHQYHTSAQNWAVVRYLGMFILATLVVIGSGNLLFQPFIQAFVTESSGAELWREGLRPTLMGQLLAAQRTSLGDFLRMYGLWVFVLTGAGLLLAQRYRLLTTTAALSIAVALLGLTWLGVLFAAPALLLLLPLLSGAALLTWRLRRLPPRLLLPLLWAGLALALSVMVELVTVRGDIGRMNTVFKFGMHTWTLFALAAAVALPWMWQVLGRDLRNSERHVRIGTYLWRGTTVVLILAALVYPLTATPARIADRYDGDLPHTLDGAAFMRYVGGNEQGYNFPLSEDAAAITWLQQNVAGTPLILEAHQPAYHWAGRVATFSGLPTVLGWEWHQIQQRNAVNAAPIIQQRKNLIAAIYTSSDADKTMRHLRDYGIEYVYVGGVERALYAGPGLDTLEQLAQQGRLERAFATGDTVIYRVVEPGKPTMLTTDLPVVPPQQDTPPPLLLDQPVNELPVVGGYAWNSLATAHTGVAVLVWLAAFYGLALLGLPLAMVIFGSWRDGGVAWARLVGLLLLGYAIWLPTSLGLWHYDAMGVLGGLLLVGVLNGALLAWMGHKARQNASGQLNEPGQPLAWSRAVGQGLTTTVVHLKMRWRAILVSEALFLAGFGIFVLFRLFNPDLWHPVWGGEKPMEFGFLNAIMRSPVMPPYDPFFSDGYINYYYYGLYLVSLPIKITGIDPAVAFNLIIATLFGLTLVGSYAIVARLTGRIRYGLLGAACVAVLGNLAGLVPVGWSRGVRPVVDALVRDGPAGLAQLGDWYVGPSRVINPPNTINEFPFWSFLFADLHPHLIALPITLLMIALAWQLFQSDAASNRIERIALLTFTALTLGTLAVTNSWDFPTYALLIGAVLVGTAWRSNRQPIAWGGLMRAVGLTVAVAVGGLLFYTPFFDHFYALVSGVGFVRDGTFVYEYLVLYGLFLAVLLPVILAAPMRLFRLHQRMALHTTQQLVALDSSVAPANVDMEAISTADPQTLALVAPVASHSSTRRRDILRQIIVYALVGAIGITLIAITLLVPSVALRLWLGVLLLIGMGLLLQRRLYAATWFVMLLAALAWAVSLGIEVVYIRDHLVGSDAYRMNTVFKFGLQIWTLLALAAAASLPYLLRGLRRASGRPAQVAGLAGLSLLVMAASIFPLVGPVVRIANRFPVEIGPTLDGLAFLHQAEFEYACATQPGCEPGRTRVSVDLQPDAEAIDWLKQNLTGTPIVLQSNLWFYRAYGIRIAANTGFPTVISALHVNEQRDPEIAGKRNSDIDRLFRTTDIEATLRLLATYGVDYIYVGAVEHAFYNPAGLNKFQAMVGSYLELVYDQPGVQIYKVREIPTIYADPPTVEFAEFVPPPRLLQNEDEQDEQSEPAIVAPSDPVISEPPVEVAEDLAELAEQAAANPTNSLLAFRLAERYRALDRLEEAASALEAAAAAHPDDAALHHLWGDILAQAGRYQDAEKAYMQAARTNPTAGNWNKLGTALLEWGQLDKGEIALSQALATDASASEPHFRMGQLYHLRGEDELAIQELETYLALDANGLYSAEVRALLEEIR